MMVQEASRVEPRMIRPMHYSCDAWDFLFIENDRRVSK